MMQTIRCAVMSVAACAALVPPAQAGQYVAAAAGAVPDEYIVVLSAQPRAGSQDGGARVAEVADALTRRHGGRVVAVWEHALRGFLAHMPEAAARRLAEDPRVRLVAQDRTHVALATIPPDCGPAGNVLNQTSTFPTSPQYIDGGVSAAGSDNWALDRVDQRLLPRNNLYGFARTGRGVHIYMLDTGIAPHQEFLDASGASRIGVGVNFASHRDDDEYAQYYAVDPNNVYDENGHGTHQASVAAGLRYGIAKSATIHPVRVEYKDKTRTGTVIDGIDWIAGHHVKPAIVNMSINFWTYCAAREFNADTPDAMVVMEDAIRYLVMHYGVAFVNSAGNFNLPASDFSPTRIPEVIAVGGSDEWDQRWAFAAPGVNCRDRTPCATPSIPELCDGPYALCDRPAFSQCGSNWGPELALFAPATNIGAAWPEGIVGWGECKQSGTSMSAPLFTGVAATYLETHPNAWPDEVRQAVVSRATTGVLPGGTLALGYGSPNKLLYLDQPPVARMTRSCSSLTCTFNGSASTDDFGITAYTWRFGDGTPSGGGAVVAHTFAAPGTYAVRLDVADSWGNVAGASTSVSVP